MGKYVAAVDSGESTVYVSCIMEPLSDMWADLKEAGGLPTKGLLLANCEAELATLMRQIDVMVTAKRAEWQQEKQILHAKLDVREQEHSITKTTLEQKHQEIGQLRGQVESLESGQKELSEQYERQLATLKAEVGIMRREYEKLKKQYKRHARGVSVDKNRANTELEDSASELRKLSRKIDEYRQQAKEWEKQRRAYEKEVETLESQRKMLEDKCELIQQQTLGYQSQLDKRRDMLDTTEMNLRSQISQLEGQLNRTRDTIKAQDSQLLHLKTALEDSVKAQRQTLEQKESIEESLRKLQAKSRQLEKELQQQQSELADKDAQLQRYDAAAQQLRQENSRLDQSISERDATIQHLDRVTLQEQTELIWRLKEELHTMLDENMKSRKSERLLREEVNELREKLDASRKDCEKLNEQMAAKIREIRCIEVGGCGLAHCKPKSFQLDDQFAALNVAHGDTVESLKKELADLTADLHRRNIAMASLSEKAARMELQMREQDENIQRKDAAIQVANAQLEALRLESRHLRRTVLRTTSGDTDDAQEQLRELQNAYNSSLAALEQQNLGLQQEVSMLRLQVHKLEDAGEYRVESALRETEQTLDKVKDTERRRVEESRQKAEQRARGLQEQLDSTVEKYESQLSQLQDETKCLRDELDLHKKSLRRLGLENEVMTTFVGGVQDVVVKPPHRESSILLTSQRHTTGAMVAERDDEHLNNQVLDPVDVVTEKFLSQQEARTRDLERKLDSHIEGLKANMEATSRKYLAER